jgi:hypothetical protein
MMTPPLAAHDDDHLLLSHCYENSLLSTRASISLASIGCTLLLLHRLWVDLERVAYTPAWFLTQTPAAHQTHTHTHTHKKAASQNKTPSQQQQQQLRIEDDDDDYDDPSAAANTHTHTHTQQQQQQQQKLLTKTLKIK